MSTVNTLTEYGKYGTMFTILLHLVMLFLVEQLQCIYYRMSLSGWALITLPSAEAKSVLHNAQPQCTRRL